MDRRQEPRFETDQPATVTLLGEGRFTRPAVIKNVSGRGMRVQLDEPLPLNAAVRVDAGNMMLLGEVCYCEPDGRFHAIGIMLEQVLHESPGLFPLIEAVRGDRSSEGVPSDR